MSTNPYESPEATSRVPVPQRSGRRATILGVLIGVVCVGLVIALFLPARRVAGEAARRAQCTNNLKQIGLALLNYESTYKTFPPAYTQDENGKRLHSWRTMILPYMEQQAIHKRVNFNKPWDDPSNQAVRETVLPPFYCPSRRDDFGAKTTYVAVVTPGGFFDGAHARKLHEISDGSDTIMIVEVDAKHAVEWMSPEDIDLDWLLDLENIEELPHNDGINVMYVDGRAERLKVDTDKAKIRALITVSAGDTK